MNISIVRGDKNLPLADFPEDLGMSVGSLTLPRYIGSGDFMSLVYKDSDAIPTCGCGETHDYYCMYDTKYRPRDFQKLREQAKELQPVFQTLIDYLEAEPNAWLEYD